MAALGMRADGAGSSRPEAFSIVNVAGGSAVRLHEFIDAVERATGVTAIQQRAPGRAGDVGGTHADVTKAAATLGWAPRIDLNTGLRETVAWWRSSAADAYRNDSSAAPT